METSPKSVPLIIIIIIIIIFICGLCQVEYRVVVVTIKQILVTVIIADHICGYNYFNLIAS